MPALTTDTARTLFQAVAANMPVFDYATSLSIQSLATNASYANLTRFFLRPSPIARRVIAPLLQGSEEATNAFQDQELFFEFAKALPYLVGSPLYQRTHHLLQSFFDIDTSLDEHSMEDIWHKTEKMLSSDAYSLQALVRKQHIQTLVAEANLLDDMSGYVTYQAASVHGFTVMPSLLLQPLFDIAAPGFMDFIRLLSGTSGMVIGNIENLLAVIENRMNYFHAHGARSAHCILGCFPSLKANPDKAEKAFQSALRGEQLKKKQANAYHITLLHHLALLLCKRNWVLHLHLGKLCQSGAFTSSFDKGYAFPPCLNQVITDVMATFFHALDSHASLPKTIIYCSTMQDYHTILAMVACLSNTHCSTRIQVVLKHANPFALPFEALDTLAVEGLLSSSIGITSFAKTPADFLQHEVYRLALCEQMGKWSESKKSTADMDVLKKVVSDVCFANAKSFFGV